MEAYTHNNALSNKDVFEVTEIVRSSLVDPSHAVQQARDFAERFSHSGSNTLHHFISKIASHSDSRVELSLLSKINTRTEPLIAEQDSSDHFTCHDDDGKKKYSIFHRSKVCPTYLLDLIIVLMAAAGSDYGALAEERSRESKDKCVPAESGKTANSFKAFSVRMWRKGVKSAGLLKDRTAAAVFDGNDEENNKNDTVATCESNNNKNKGEFQLEEIHGSKQNDSKSTGGGLEGKTRDTQEEKSLSDLASSPDNVIKHEGANEMITDINTTHATQRKKPRRKLPNLTDGLLATPGQTERRRLTALTLVKKLELEKHELSRNEANALKSQLEMLIKDNRDITASLAAEKTEKHNAFQKCKELQEQLDERERSSRQHAFILNSRMERLQHAKLAADQRCLNLSLRQERFEVYEEQATLICQRLIETVRKEFEERRGLFGVAPTKYNCSTAHCTFDDFPATGEGFEMYEAHRKLQKYVVGLVKRYSVVMQLLTRTKGEHEELGDYYEQESSSYLATIEEGKDEVLKYLTENDEHYRQHSDVTFGVPLELKSYCAMNHHEVPDHHIKGQNTLTVQERQGRETPLKLRRKPDKKTRKGTDKHRDQELQVEDDHGKDETTSLKDLPSSSGSMVSVVKQYPRRSNSLNTIDVSRHHDQRSCSSIVALVRSGQRSSDIGVKTRNVECSACRKNKEQRMRVKKTMSSCNSRGRTSDVHYV